MPENVVTETAKKYREAFETLTGKKWEDVLASEASAKQHEDILSVYQ